MREAPEEEGNSRTMGAMGRGRSRGGVQSQLITRKMQKFLDEINVKQRDPNKPLEGADARDRVSAQKEQQSEQRPPRGPFQVKKKLQKRNHEKIQIQEERSPWETK